MNYVILFFFVCKSFILLHATEFPPKIVELLNRNNRPTIQDVITAFDNNLPPNNPFSTFIEDLNIDAVRKSAITSIVELEYAYPGAIYAFLGRDASRMADIFETFYLVHQMPNRVIRLNASGQSFRKREDYNGLLISAGLINKH